MPKLTLRSVTLNLLLLTKLGDKCGEELSQPGIKPAKPFLHSPGHDGESLCQGIPQQWAYFVACLSFLSQGAQVPQHLKVSDPQ